MIINATLMIRFCFPDRSLFILSPTLPFYIIEGFFPGVMRLVAQLFGNA